MCHRLCRLWWKHLWPLLATHHRLRMVRRWFEGREDKWTRTHVQSCVRWSWCKNIEPVRKCTDFQSHQKFLPVEALIHLKQSCETSTAYALIRSNQKKETCQEPLQPCGDNSKPLPDSLSVTHLQRHSGNFRLLANAATERSEFFCSRLFNEEKRDHLKSFKVCRNSKVKSGRRFAQLGVPFEGLVPPCWTPVPVYTLDKNRFSFCFEHL